MKNQRGVTLIALVVTIIVLIILAGVAIAALTGQNGLITRSREAKALQIRGEVGDRVTLAIGAAKLAAEREATKTAGFQASKNLSASSVIGKAIEEDLGSDYTTGDANSTYSKLGYKVSYTNATTGETPTDGKIVITYKTDAYDQAMNTSATITYNITVKGNSFSFDTNTPTLTPEAINP